MKKTALFAISLFLVVACSSDENPPGDLNDADASSQDCGDTSPLDGGDTSPSDGGDTSLQDCGDIASPDGGDASAPDADADGSSRDDLASRCAQDADCESGVCLPLGGGQGLCTEICSSSDPCAPGWRCSEVEGGDPDVCQPDNSVVDLLWVIDNTASMCRVQTAIRENVNGLVDSLIGDDVDFQFGIVTTHMSGNQVSAEPVARPGVLQSTPQPLPGFDRICRFPMDSTGELDLESVALAREQIDVAISCTVDPESWAHLQAIDDEEFLCVLKNDGSPCDLTMEEFFPSPESYREIPRLLRSEDYRDEEGVFDRDGFLADFGCASLVGTRGWGFKQGLASAVMATSPEMLAGENEGLIRHDSKVGVVFVSDENDCSHDGSLNEQATCGIGVCEIEENLGEDGALLSTEDLAHQFFTNIAMAKNLDAADGSFESVKNAVAPYVAGASFHGAYQRDTTLDWDECTFEYGMTESCSSEYGPAFSGHRYAEFLSHFPLIYPYSPSAEGGSSIEPQNIEGLLCSDISTRFAEMGEALF